MAAAFSAWVGYEGQPAVELLVEKASGSIYAQVTEKTRRIVGEDKDRKVVGTDDDRQSLNMMYTGEKIVINGRNLDTFVGSRDYTDEEVKAELEELFGGTGTDKDGLVVSVETNADSTARTVTLKLARIYNDQGEELVFESDSVQDDGKDDVSASYYYQRRIELKRWQDADGSPTVLQITVSLDRTW
jgi:hypothetical protein